MFAILHPKLIAAIAATGVILGAVYMLYMFQRVMFGPNANPKNHRLPDLSAREVAVFLPMVLMAFWLGIHPSTFLKDIDPAVQHVLSDFKAKYAEAPEKGDTPRVMGFERRAAPSQPTAAMPAPAPAMPAPIPAVPSPSAPQGPMLDKAAFEKIIAGQGGHP